MNVPLSWLKDYVDVKLDPKKLGERLTEIGLDTERVTKTDNDVIFELEITPNRPDLLSIIGVAREIAAIENKKLKYPTQTIDVRKIKPKKVLPLTIKTDFTINPRFTGIIIDGIRVKESPKWLKERLTKIGQRSINNIVDITNYVMFELGNPIHAFDYHKIKGHTLQVTQSTGGEEFKSVDGITYRLPKGAVIIKDKEQIIDLCGIKGGYNSGTFEDTKTIFLRVPVENPILIRKASQALGLRSQASSIFERGVNAGGTLEALSRAVYLILANAGGSIASDVYDLKEKPFTPRTVTLKLSRLEKILGIALPVSTVLAILSSLNLHPKKERVETITTTIPPYRNDLQIEEDLIEEVARHYGYNNFPKTLPIGQIPTKQIPYFKDYRLEEKVKQVLRASGFSEIYTYSLISEQDLVDEDTNPEHILRVDNPVSKEFEYLRPALTINLKKAYILNKANYKNINLFELGKVYEGINLSEAKETYNLCLISNSKNFRELLGIYETLLKELNISEDQKNLRTFSITNDTMLLEIRLSELFKVVQKQKIFIPIPKYPPITEDIALVVQEKTRTGNILSEIKKQSNLIVTVDLIDQFEDSLTFHIVYQHRERNLTSEEVARIRVKILKALGEKFHVKLKE